MVSLERAAKAWTDLGRVLYPSLAEVEAELASRAHTNDARHYTTDRAAHQAAGEEDP